MTAALPKSDMDSRPQDGIGGWFPDQNRLNLSRLIQEHRVRTVVEVGTFLGLSAAFFASFDQIESVVCVDPFCEYDTARRWNNLVETLEGYRIPNPFFHLFKENMERLGCWAKIRPVIGLSKYVSGNVPDADLVYLDGDHSLEGLRSDLALYGPKARKVLCGDDYHLDPKGAPFFPGVRQGVDELGGCSSDGPFWWKVV